MRVYFFLFRSYTCSGWGGGFGSHQTGTAATEAADVAAVAETGNTGSALHLALRNLANDSGMGYVLVYDEHTQSYFKRKLIKGAFFNLDSTVILYCALAIPHSIQSKQDAKDSNASICSSCNNSEISLVSPWLDDLWEHASSELKGGEAEGNLCLARKLTLFGGAVLL
jgi:hypothetical protein